MATFSYDASIEPSYVDVLDIASGYGILSIPIDGFLPGDVIQALALTIAPRTGSGATIAKAIDMVQRADGFFEYVTQDSISAHFTLTAADLVVIAAGTYAYSATATVLRSGVTVTREVQGGNIAARPQAATPSLIVSTIVISGGPVTGVVGATAPLTATCKDAYGNTLVGQVVSWVSSNPIVARVDQSGLVTFLTPGVCTITASTQGIAATTGATTNDVAFSAPSTNQVPMWTGAAWLPEFVTPAAMKPGTFGDDSGHDPYIFPHGVQAGTLAGDGSAVTALDMGHASAGTLPIVRGGTGLAALVAGALFVANVAASALTSLAPGAAGGFVRSDGTQWTRALITAADVSDLSSAATGITKVGTVDTGVWHGTAIVDTYIATISTPGKVANAATTATATNTASAIVARDSNGDFSARVITATSYAGTWAGSSIPTSLTDAKVVSVSGTSNRVAVTGTASVPVVDISASYIGQATITTLGTVTAGTWTAAVVAGAYGGTGVANVGKSITLAHDFTTAGGFAIILTATGATNVTLPTSGTLITASVSSLPSLTAVGVLAAPHMTAAVVDSGGLTVTAGGVTVTAGGLSVSGATSVAALTTSGDLTVGASKFTAAASSGNTVVGGTLAVTGAATFSTPIADTSLATISTAGKIANGATTATSNNTASTIVARDGAGNFSATTISAAFVGDLTGTASAALSASAGGLSGTTLAGNVVASSLTSLGVLSHVNVSNGGVHFPTSTVLGRFTSLAGVAAVAFGNGDTLNNHAYIGGASSLVVMGGITDLGVLTEYIRISNAGLQLAPVGTFCIGDFAGANRVDFGATTGGRYTFADASNALAPISVLDLETGDPGAGAATWQLGGLQTASVALDTAHYVQVKIAGTLRKLAVVT